MGSVARGHVGYPSNHIETSSIAPVRMKEQESYDKNSSQGPCTKGLYKLCTANAYTCTIPLYSLVFGHLLRIWRRGVNLSGARIKCVSKYMDPSLRAANSSCSAPGGLLSWDWLMSACPKLIMRLYWPLKLWSTDEPQTLQCHQLSRLSIDCHALQTTANKTGSHWEIRD